MRTFVAVDVSTKSAIARLQAELSSEAAWETKAVKPVEPQNFHFTLFFLGEIADSDVACIRLKLSSLQFDPFVVSYSGVGAFPRPQAARIVWVGVDPTGASKLSELAGKVVAALSELGFKPDKPFSPHLTVFRVKSREPVNMAALMQKYGSIQLGTDRIDQLHLKKSELTPQGPIYSNVYTVEATS